MLIGVNGCGRQLDYVLADRRAGTLGYSLRTRVLRCDHLKRLTVYCVVRPRSATRNWSNDIARRG